MTDAPPLQKNLKYIYLGGILLSGRLNGNVSSCSLANRFVNLKPRQEQLDPYFLDNTHIDCSGGTCTGVER